ncbi:transcription termination factor 2 [Ostrinia furnacalis]|uniref:transcription termination factor 2 n=1 Tax=Ostrinia furnacalis TaxID=93504 RepID=UPI00103BC913|nr:transcription termination factor 2 [Ostrinia furnacalis]
MENSFFEYRDKTEMDSDSDSEIIDNSLVVAQPFSSAKTPNSKNRTVFVAESEESTSDETDQEDNEPLSKLKSVVERSSVQNQHVVLSSDDDGSNRGSIRRQSPSSPNKVVLSSSDEEEEEVSPELVPRRRPPMRPKSIDSNSDSFIGRFKSKKRMILMDSDTENSIVIEHDKNRKVKCLKDTPLKIDSGKKVAIAKSDDNMSGDDESDEASTEDDEDNDEDENGDDDDDDDGPDEDQMVMSRATRMSIMGVAPKNGDSDDESDFIQSDDSKPNSRVGSACSFNDLPDVSTCIRKSQKTDQKENKHDEEENCSEAEQDTSRLTCSPFTSPLKDITNDGNKNTNSQNISIIDLDLKENDSQELKNKVLSNLVQEHSYNKNAPDDDDDVTIIDSKPEIIALSSDDEEDVTTEKKSPTLKKSPSIKKSPKAKDEDTSSQSRNGNPSIKQFLAPPSYPNQVVYVKKHVRENELSKLNSLKEDLHNIRNLLENMDVSTLPDGGVRLIERLSALEGEVRRQGDKVANMLVEPDQPTAEEIARDGFDKGLSWDDIQKASNAVQPRMFGKQAMATHMAERNLILDRLRILHESLATRPPEQAQASAPAALRSSLMPHQRHALAWLRWRETQRPYGGILADDMGLGKTITMISLILTDKEASIDDDDDDEEAKGKNKMTRGGTLVVCPASLMQQWAGEVTSHCTPHALSVCLHHGAARAAQPHRLAASDLVVTTYNILQRDAEKNGVLMRVRWRRVILDEAHIVRNHKAATSLAVSALPGRRRWCLTGTPVQNKDLDLFALMKFLRVTPFDDLAMWKKWIDNKSQGGQERLSTIMRCILLRRTKQQLQDAGQLACLPPRSAHQRPVTLAPQEMQVYQKVGRTRRTTRRQAAGQDYQEVGRTRRTTRRQAAGQDYQEVGRTRRTTRRQAAGQDYQEVGRTRRTTRRQAAGQDYQEVGRTRRTTRRQAAGQDAGQLACLPPRSAHQRPVTLAPQEMQVYQKVLVFSKTLFAQFLHQRAEKQADAGGFVPPEKDSAYAAMHKKMIALQGAKPVKSHEILVLLLRLRQVCCHCGLIASMLDAEGAASDDPAGADLLAELDKLTLDDARAGREVSSNRDNKENEDDGPEESTTVAEAIRSVLAPNNPVFDLARQSSKIKAVMDCLRENVFKNKDEKAVVVSQWTSVLRLVEQELKRMKIRSVTLSGNVPVGARPPLIAALNQPGSGVQVMLLSLCAGGVGLNLCGANHLLLLDPHWNPQLEQQAQDRIYRVGQKKHVHIYRFMCVDTVEQSIRKLQEAKLELAENVLTGAKHTNSKLSIDDLKLLFNMGQPGS